MSRLQGLVLLFCAVCALRPGEWIVVYTQDLCIIRRVHMRDVPAHSHCRQVRIVGLWLEQFTTEPGTRIFLSLYSYRAQLSLILVKCLPVNLSPVFQQLWRSTALPAGL